MKKVITIITIILLAFLFTMPSLAEDYDDGYEEGYDIGNEYGYEDGYEEGYGTGYDEGYDEAVFDMSDKDFKTVIENETDIAYSNGYTEGYKKGKKEATPAQTYDDGIQIGYKQATVEYEEKLNNAVEDAKKDNIYNIIISICITAVISFILGLIITSKKKNKNEE